jgi:hypothetical protein
MMLVGYTNIFGFEYSSHNAPHLLVDSSVYCLEIITRFKHAGINTERKQTVKFTWTCTNSLERELCNWCCAKGRVCSSQRRWVKTPWNIFPPVIFFFCGPSSLVGIATGYRLDGPEIESRKGGRRFTALGPVGPPSLLYNRYRVFLSRR